jgi:hypothetical protein
MITDVKSEDRLVQKTFADHLQDHLGLKSIYVYNTETFGSVGNDIISANVSKLAMCLDMGRI